MIDETRVKKQVNILFNIYENYEMMIIKKIHYANFRFRRRKKINKNLRQMMKKMREKNATNSAHKIYHVYVYTRMLDFKFNITYVKLNVDANPIRTRKVSN